MSRPDNIVDISIKPQSQQVHVKVDPNGTGSQKQQVPPTVGVTSNTMVKSQVHWHK